ncbi:hypothetical protein FPOA_11920 [Fusarium poae]|uniref:Apple domain-containing protein n=1 Tax=Fusarium poae TaxID=36050 RepID=A0A1B8AI86_FUSPO|nr:hypothetical protein FPOA_11920 [Fusarium poae]
MMNQQVPDNEGLQVDTHAHQADKAPEVVPHDHNTHGHVPEYEAPSSKRQKPPFGLGLWVFAGLVALLTALIVGAGVGGGLGAALMNKSSDCQEETASTSSPADVEPTSCPTQSNNTSENDTAPYVPKPPSEVSALRLICPDDKQDETKYKSRKGYEFRWWCGVDAPNGQESKEGGGIYDVSIFSYTIGDCMEACANLYKKGSGNKIEPNCRSLVFSMRMANYVDNHNANCFLKNGSKAVGSKWNFVDEYYAYAEIVS